MRVLHVIASMDPVAGGTSQGIRNSIPELKKMGVVNEVVCLDPKNADYIKDDSFVIHAIGPAKGPWQYSSKLLPWLKENMLEFDVIIINGLWLYHGFATKKALTHLYKKGNKILKSNLPKLFVMPHGMLDPYFQKASGRKLKAMRNWLYWKFIESKVVNNANGVLFTCEAELELARQAFTPYTPKNEINVGYGIPAPPVFINDMKVAFEQTCPMLKNRNYLLFLSRIHEKKGVDILIKTYKKFVASSSQIPCLVIAGPGLETSYGKELLDLVDNDSKLKSLVFFVGMLSGNSKWGAFYGCEAFVLPSHQENFGIAVVEALSCAKPVLISNQVNIWHEIEASNGGFVANDTEAGMLILLEKWIGLAAEERTSMAVNAKQTYEKYFAIESAATRMYNTMMASL